MDERPYSQIKAHLVQVDEVLARVMASVDETIEPALEIDIYKALLQSIVSQQLSTKVADIIWNRFLDMFPNRYPQPELIVQMPEIDLRNVGFSRQKTGYIKNVAQFALEHDMSFDALAEMDDNDVIDFLTQIKGVGRWTVQMVLMFPMDRPNVFPVDDYGIQSKMKHWYQLDSEKKMLKQQLEEIADKWRPYRSLACKYIWASQTK